MNERMKYLNYVPYVSTRFLDEYFWKMLVTKPKTYVHVDLLTHDKIRGYAAPIFETKTKIYPRFPIEKRI